MEATTIEGIETRELKERLWLVINTQSAGRTHWFLQEAEQANPMSGVHQASVELVHPSIQPTSFGGSPLNEGRVKIRVNPGSYYQRDDYVTIDRARAVAEMLDQAIQKQARLLKELEPQVKKELERFEKEKQEREERRKKAEEERQKQIDLREKIRAVESEWLAQFAEAIKWYEGQAGRIKREGKSGVNRFSAMGYVRGGTLYWTGMSGRTHSDSAKNIKYIEIRYESERSTERIELPKYPKAEVEKLQKELNALRGY